MNKPHKHADLIKAWADGAEIEAFTDESIWVSIRNPSWYDHIKYRIKPEPKEPRRIWVNFYPDRSSPVPYAWLTKEGANLAAAPGRSESVEFIELLPWESLGQIVEVLTYGAQKYSPDNWQRVPDPQNRYFAAVMRHLHAYRLGDALDSESGLPHLAHAACCVLFMMHFDLYGAPEESSK